LLDADDDFSKSIKVQGNLGVNGIVSHKTNAPERLWQRHPENKTVVTIPEVTPAHAASLPIRETVYKFVRQTLPRSPS
jgi:hypothetical protein